MKCSMETSGLHFSMQNKKKISRTIHTYKTEVLCDTIYRVIRDILSLNLLERFTEYKLGTPVMTIYTVYILSYVFVGDWCIDIHSYVSVVLHGRRPQKDPELVDEGDHQRPINTGKKIKPVYSSYR